MEKGYDAKCLELAEHFLPNDAPVEARRDLAQHIQDQVEMWLSGSEFDL